MKIASLIFCLTILSFGSVKSQNWLTDISEAKSEALNQSQSIILVFQGSDWCAPCIKLDREIWHTDEFKAYADEHFVMLKADFPRKKQNKLSKEQEKHNNELAEKYNKEGFFPLVVVLDSEGNVLGKTGYKKTTPFEYIELLSSFK